MMVTAETAIFYNSMIVNTSLKAKAAVAIIEVRSPAPCYLLLRRTSNPSDPWSGHFSFPGGRKEQSDTTLFDTCLRETSEETGIRLSRTSFIRSLPLSPAGRATGRSLWVQPFLFSLSSRPELALEAKEIQSSCWLEADFFRNLANHQQVEMVPGMLFPAVPIDDYYVWGFTYRLLEMVIN